MANRRRGDVDFVLDGQALTLRLTLGALAEMETALGAGDLAALGARFEAGRFSARDIAAILGAAARGGGAALTNDEMAGALVAGDVPRAMSAVAALLEASFGEGASANPPMPQAG